MFVFDIETLSTESKAVILSAGIIYCTGEETPQELMDKSLFIKFDVDEQVTKWKRLVDREVIDWWGKQGDYQKKASFFYDKANDIDAVTGLNALKGYVKLHNPDKTAPMFIRGSLDQLCIDSLAKDAGVEFIYPYHKYRDVRTAVDLLKETSDNGYCQIPEGTIPEGFIAKHHPVHDCILDAMMLLKGL